MAGRGRLPAALVALALLLLLLARLAPPPPQPHPRPRPLALMPLSMDASSTTYGNRTHASSPPDTTRIPLNPEGSNLAAEVDNVAFEYNSVDGVSKANEGVSKVNEGVSKVNEGVSKVNEGVSKVNEISKINEILSKVNEGVSKASGTSKVNVGDAGIKATSGAKSSDPGVLLTSALMTEGHRRAHPEICPALGAKVKVLILVTSAPNHFAPRQAIRLTWGHFATRADIALGFVLGAPPDTLRQKIDEEDALYGDIIEGNFVDAYTNLTLKTLSMLEWATTYCPRARMLLKTDDDMFINVPLLVEFVDQRANATNTIWGKVLHKALPKRIAKSKYYLSRAQYPAAVLPDFATGPAYLMTRDVVQKLRDAAPDEKYLCLEDVFITGVLASRLHITRVHAPQFHNKRAAASPCMLKKRVALHMVLHKALPKRIAKSKYYLSRAQYPAAVLPDFATGPAYLMTRDVVQKLRDAAPDEKYLCLEDVFITGVLASRLHITRVHAPQFHNKRAAASPCMLKKRVALHMVRYHEQFDLWRKLLDGTAKCKP